MAGDEPVTSPDQHKPVNVRRARTGAIVTALILLAMLFPRHAGHVEDIWLIGIAAALVLWVVVDWVLRRNGLRS